METAVQFIQGNDASWGNTAPQNGNPDKMSHKIQGELNEFPSEK